MQQDELPAANLFGQPQPVTSSDLEEVEHGTDSNVSFL